MVPPRNHGVPPRLLSVALEGGRADTCGTPAGPAQIRSSEVRRKRLTAKKSVLAALGLLVAALALVAAGCGGGDGGAEVVALPSSSCTGLEYEGDGSPDYIIASDFPLQGSSRTQTEQIVAAMREKGIDHEYLLFPDEGHGFAKPENRLRFYATAERFLARHLGGRCETEP